MRIHRATLQIKAMLEETYDEKRKGVARELFTISACRKSWGERTAIVSPVERRTFGVVESLYLPPK